MATKTEPKWVRRRIKAARLMGLTPILVSECSEKRIAGIVGGDSGEYRVIVRADGTFECSCEWGAHHSNQRDPCSHALALAMLWDLNPYLDAPRRPMSPPSGGATAPKRGGQKGGRSGAQGA